MDSEKGIESLKGVMVGFVVPWRPGQGCHGNKGPAHGGLSINFSVAGMAFAAGFRADVLDLGVNVLQGTLVGKAGVIPLGAISFRFSFFLLSRPERPGPNAHEQDHDDQKESETKKRPPDPVVVFRARDR